MKILSYFFPLLIVALTTGCLDPSCCDQVNSHQFSVSLVDSEGANLLDPQTAGAVDLKKSRLYLIEDGEAKMFKYGGGGVLDNPYGVAPIEIDGKSGAQISFIYEGNEKDIEGFIQWNETMADTLNFTFSSSENPRHFIRISQGGKKLWDKETKQLFSISITLIH